MKQITLNDIKNNEEINTYIKMADNNLGSMGFTEHSFAHLCLVGARAKEILSMLNFSQRDCELAEIAAYMHDIGNMVNRVGHAHHGAIIAFQILSKLNMPPNEIAIIVSVIGNHDEKTASTVNHIAAAMMLADKSDIRRSRVRNQDATTFDIHDRVNYAVEKSEFILNEENKSITIKLKIDTEICPVINYFEIFLDRMMLCKKAAHYLDLIFHIEINGSRLL